MGKMTLPENLKFVNCYGPCAGNGVGTSGDYVSLKNVLRAYVIVKHAGANDTDLVIAIKEATAVAGTSAAAITATMPIWVSPGTTSDDLQDRQTDAATYTLDPATLGSAIVIIEVDPAILSAGFDCIQAYTTGGHASNFVDVIYALQMAYAQDPAPAAVTD